MRLLLGALEPDKAAHLQQSQDGKQGLREANNCYPSPNGYRPVPAFSAITDALDEEFKGGVTFVSSDGTISLLAGTATDLYLHNSSLAWTSIQSGLAANRWYFTKFGDFGIGTFGDVPTEIDIANQTAAALSGSPPTADGCMTVRDFLILLRCDGLNNNLRWSGFQDRTEWVAGTNQSGEQEMLDGGEITGWAGGEYGLIFQRGRIVRMTYVGVPTIWQFDEISSNVGCVTPGALTQVGRLVFFLSHRGWHVTDGNDVKAIGDEAVDRTFLEDFSPDDLEQMYATVDPKAQIVTFIMPSRQFHYHMSLGQWTTGDQHIKAAFQGFTAGVNLEQLDAIYGDLDAMGDISLDDPRFKGGDPQLLFVNADDEVGVLSGDNIAATWLLPHIEIVQGREARLNSIRPITDATSGITIQGNSRRKLGEAGGTDNVFDMRTSGDIPCRMSGRFLRFRVSIEAGASWSYFQGLDLNAIAAGGRR